MEHSGKQVLVSEYFSPSSSSKRKELPSSSSEGDSPVVRPVNKRINIIDSSTHKTSKSDSNMSPPIEETLAAMQRCMQTLSTKEDIQEVRDGIRSVKDELEAMRLKIQERFKQIESRIFETEVNVDNVEKEALQLRKENLELRERIEKAEAGLNDIEQYGRRWNLRVFNVKERANEKTSDTMKKVCQIFTDQVGVTTTVDDLEACHRVGAAEGSVGGTGGAGSSRRTFTRTIVVRFKNRQLRDDVLANRKKLKGDSNKVSVGEDLTFHNARLSKEAYKHSASMSSWTVNGKVFAKLKNGKRLQIKYGTNVDELFRKEMGSVQ